MADNTGKVTERFMRSLMTILEAQLDGFRILGYINHERTAVVSYTPPWPQKIDVHYYISDNDGELSVEVINKRSNYDKNYLPDMISFGEKSDIVRRNVDPVTMAYRVKQALTGGHIDYSFTEATDTIKKVCESLGVSSERYPDFSGYRQPY